jgi:hypothetical protein
VTNILQGRVTARSDKPVIVFAIGMRVNRLYAIHKWFRPTVNTFRMWWYMQHQRPKGYLSGYLFLYSRGAGMMQYWESFEALEAFSHDKSQPHLAAWRHLAMQSKHDQTFGYWHETYQIAPETSECIYGNMPQFGLAEAIGHLPIGKKAETARGRLNEASADS